MWGRVTWVCGCSGTTVRGLLTAPRALGVSVTMSPCGCWPRPPPMDPLLPPVPRPLRPRGAGESLAPYSELWGSYVGSPRVFHSSSPPSSTYVRRDMVAELSLLAARNCSSRITNMGCHGLTAVCWGHGVPQRRRCLSLAASFIDHDPRGSRSRLH